MTEYDCDIDFADAMRRHETFKRIESRNQEIRAFNEEMRKDEEFYECNEHVLLRLLLMKRGASCIARGAMHDTCKVFLDGSCFRRWNFLKDDEEIKDMVFEMYLERIKKAVDRLFVNKEQYEMDENYYLANRDRIEHIFGGHAYWHHLTSIAVLGIIDLEDKYKQIEAELDKFMMEEGMKRLKKLNSPIRANAIRDRTMEIKAEMQKRTLWNFLKSYFTGI